MSRSCPFHSFQLPLHVPDIFSVCPLHCPCMSRSCVASHFPTSPVVPIGFLVPCFPCIPPALPLFHFCPFHVPFSSPLCPFHFPLLSCHVDFLFPPLISLHFLAFPLGFPSQKKRFSSVFAKRTSKNTEFSRFSAKRGRKPTPKAGRGNRAWDPCFETRRLRLVERHQIAARYVGDPAYLTSGGGGE